MFSANCSLIKLHPHICHLLSHFSSGVIFYFLCKEPHLWNFQITRSYIMGVAVWTAPIITHPFPTILGSSQKLEICTPFQPKENSIGSFEFFLREKGRMATSLFILMLLLLLQLFPVKSQNPPAAAALYVFGDSLSDSGNNNNRLTTARANYPPYGVDFVGGTTGRFTNGKTFVDFAG